MKNKCDICGQYFTGHGNNPSPLRGNICCDVCNSKIVIPLRIYLSQNNLSQKSSNYRKENKHNV